MSNEYKDWLQDIQEEAKYRLKGSEYESYYKEVADICGSLIWNLMLKNEQMIVPNTDITEELKKIGK